jgi:hypothetical protein
MILMMSNEIKEDTSKCLDVFQEKLKYRVELNKEENAGHERGIQ